MQRVKSKYLACIWKPIRDNLCILYICLHWIPDLKILRVPLNNVYKPKRYCCTFWTCTQLRCCIFWTSAQLHWCVFWTCTITFLFLLNMDSYTSASSEHAHSYIAVPSEHAHSYFAISSEHARSHFSVSSEHTHSYIAVSSAHAHSYIAVSSEHAHSYTAVSSEHAHCYIALFSEHAHSYISVVSVDVYFVHTHSVKYIYFFSPLYFSSSSCLLFFHPFLSFTFPSFLSTITQRPQHTSNFFSYLPLVANAPLILTDSRIRDCQCSLMPQTPLDTTVPTGHYIPHWTLQASLDTTVSTRHYRPHWTLQSPLDTTVLTEHYRLH